MYNCNDQVFISSVFPQFKISFIQCFTAVMGKMSSRVEIKTLQRSEQAHFLISPLNFALTATLCTCASMWACLQAVINITKSS